MQYKAISMTNIKIKLNRSQAEVLRDDLLAAAEKIKPSTTAELLIKELFLELSIHLDTKLQTEKAKISMTVSGAQAIAFLAHYQQHPPQEHYLVSIVASVTMDIDQYRKSIINQY